MGTEFKSYSDLLRLYHALSAKCSQLYGRCRQNAVNCMDAVGKIVRISDRPGIIGYTGGAQNSAGGGPATARVHAYSTCYPIPGCPEARVPVRPCVRTANAAAACPSGLG